MTNPIQDELVMLVSAERDRPEAGLEAADRVWSGVQARIEGAPPPASVPANTPWGVLSVVGGVLLACVAGGWAYSGSPEPSHFDGVPAPVLAVVADEAELPALHVELPSDPVPELPEEEPEETQASDAKKPRRENAGTVADELALIERARTALSRGQAKSALGVLRTHRRQFPKGAFLEEGAALRASALCDSGKTDAAKKASTSFLRRYPNSVHKNRVKDCAAQ